MATGLFLKKIQNLTKSRSTYTFNLTKNNIIKKSSMEQCQTIVQVFNVSSKWNYWLCRYTFKRSLLIWRGLKYFAVWAELNIFPLPLVNRHLCLCHFSGISLYWITHLSFSAEGIKKNIFQFRLSGIFLLSFSERDLNTSITKFDVKLTFCFFSSFLRSPPENWPTAKAPTKTGSKNQFQPRNESLRRMAIGTGIWIASIHCLENLLVLALQ